MAGSLWCFLHHLFYLWIKLFEECRVDSTSYSSVDVLFVSWIRAFASNFKKAVPSKIRLVAYVLSKFVTIRVEVMWG